MTIRLVATAYALPDEIEDVAAVLERERGRVDTALQAIGPSLRSRVEAGLAIQHVRVCRPGERPFRLAAAAAREALGRAGLVPEDVDLIIDYSTLPGPEAAYEPLAHALAADLDLEVSLNLNLKYSGCAAFHVAVKLAVGLMNSDEQLRVALLVAGDSAPEGSRSLLPITIQGDVGSAAVLSRDSVSGTEIVATEVMTLGRLHRIIDYTRDSQGQPVLVVDATRIEKEVIPVYYLHFDRLVAKVLESAGLSRDAVALVVYANVSGSDSIGFARSLGFDPGIVRTPGLRDCGHTFASDLVLNYTMLDAAGQVKPGDWLLFAAAGIGFTWGVTLARA